MSKLIIKTEGNSLEVNGTIYQKGKLHFTECENGIIFGNTRCDYTDVTCNGAVLGSPAELYTWLKQSVFSDGGGSGTGAVNSVTGTLVTGTTENPIVDNPLLEVHRVLLTDGGNRTITDFGGTISIVKNGLEQVDSFTLTWGALTTETAKLTVIFTFDCVVNNIATSGVTINRLPISVKTGDVWTVVYDKFYNEWNLVSLNTSAGIPTGTDRDVLSWDSNGSLKADRITAWQLTDINGRPSFSFGVLAGASLQDDKPLLLFTEASTVAKSGTLPLYKSNGRMAVGTATAPEDALNLGQINGFFTGNVGDIVAIGDSGKAVSKRIGWKEMMPSGYPEPETPYVGVLSYITNGSDYKEVGLFSVGSNPVTGEAVLQDKHIPVYDSNGTLPIGNATSDSHAINLGQLNSRTYNVINVTTGRTFTLADAGMDKLLNCYGMVGSFTIPPSSSVNFPIGSVINIAVVSSTITLVQGAGVDLQAEPSDFVYGGKKILKIIKVATDRWVAGV